MLSFKNCNIYMNNKSVIKSDLTIKDGKFDNFLAAKNAIELDDKYIIVPGFIEQHIHGAAGCDTMDGKESSLHTISKALVQDGVTGWLPTTMTLQKDEIIKTLKVIGNTQTSPDEAKILGIHLEGPFISKRHLGAMDGTYVLVPNTKDLNDFVSASNNKIRIVTTAVEFANKEYYDYCKDHDIVVSVGHTSADCSDVEKAYKLGLGCSTHTYNAMHKVENVDETVCGICKTPIYAEVILDLLHVTKKEAAFLFKHKIDRIILVSDSMSGKYMPNGIYKLGKLDVIVKDGKAILPGGKKAGSVLQLPQALRNVSQVVDISFERTIDLVAKNPATNLNLDKVGCIKKGYWADFAIIDKDFNVYQTYINGKLVYDSKKMN